MAGKIQKHLARNAFLMFKEAHSVLRPSRRTRAVFILGVQRSGTTLLLDCLERSLEVSVMGESSQKAMVNFRIKDDRAIRRLIGASRYKVIVFKPLTDSHRVREFLDLTPTSVVIWAYRRVEDRANSAVAKFGAHNLEILREFSAGKGFERWQAQGLTDAKLQVIRSFDYTDMSPHTAAAIFWWIRNSLFFDHDLGSLDTVLPVAYEELVRSPDRMMPGICRFIGCEFNKEMIRNVHAKSIKREQSRIDGRVQQMCDEMYENLQRAQQQTWAKLALLAGERRP